MREELKNKGTAVTAIDTEGGGDLYRTDWNYLMHLVTDMHLFSVNVDVSESGKEYTRFWFVNEADDRINYAAKSFRDFTPA